MLRLHPTCRFSGCSSPTLPGLFSCSRRVSCSSVLSVVLNRRLARVRWHVGPTFSLVNLLTTFSFHAGHTLLYSLYSSVVLTPKCSYSLASLDATSLNLASASFGPPPPTLDRKGTVCFALPCSLASCFMVLCFVPTTITTHFPLICRLLASRICFVLHSVALTCGCRSLFRHSSARVSALVFSFSVLGSHVLFSYPFPSELD